MSTTMMRAHRRAKIAHIVWGTAAGFDQVIHLALCGAFLRSDRAQVVATGHPKCLACHKSAGY